MSKLLSSRPQNVQDVVLVSIREASRLLSVSVRTLHRYTALGILPSVPVGRRKLFRKDDLLKFAENGLSLEALRQVKANANGR